MPDKLSVITHILVALTALTLAGSYHPIVAHASNAEPISAAILATWRQLYARPVANVAVRKQPQHGNGTTPALIALGARLFRDTRLSHDGSRSCATCHQEQRGFTDGQSAPFGPDGVAGKRNTPTLWNIHAASALHWDGTVRTLEEQARLPIENRLELNSSIADVVPRLSRDPDVERLARRAFPGAFRLTPDHITTALAAFERTLISPPTRFDSWIAGNETALKEDEKSGFALFVGKGGCARCHTGWRFTDDRVHDIGLPTSEKRTAFKTPTLRELTSTGPYMHDGSVATLEAAVRHYTSSVIERPTLSPNLTVGLELSDHEIRQLVAFLKTLSQH